MFTPSLHLVSYSHFCITVRQHAGRKIRNKGCRTYLYDHKNRLLAMFKAGSLDNFGRVKPAEYFVRSA